MPPSATIENNVFDILMKKIKRLLYNVKGLGQDMPSG